MYVILRAITINGIVAGNRACGTILQYNGIVLFFNVQSSIFILITSFAITIDQPLKRNVLLISFVELRELKNQTF